MVLRVLCILLIFQVSTACYSQVKSEQKSGKVSLITSNNVYVKFNNTDAINIGDTLEIALAGGFKACLLVQHKSSISCVCIPVKGCEVKKDDPIIHRQQLNSAKDKILEEKRKLDDNKKFNDTKQESVKKKIKKKENITGMISAGSNSNLSSIRDDRHRMMYTFSLDADHINDSKFSLETYINYTQNFVPTANYTQQKTFFRVQNLALKYDADSTLSIIAGRKINNKASSFGAIDGLQGEKYFGNFYVGLLAGFKPNIVNHAINSGMYQYGGYMGIKADNKKIHTLSTLGLLEQRNKTGVDRRYAYLQSSTTIHQALTVFSSAELDLYSKVGGNVANNVRMTSLYLSAQYRISKMMDVFVSYDSRKRVLYYETYKTDIDILLSDDDARQGARARLNFRPFKNTSAGIGYNKRFQNSGQNKSDNYSGYITYSKLPLIGGLLSFDYNYNSSNYLESKVMSGRHSRYMLKKKLNADIYYRMVNYTYLINETKFEQQYFGGGLSYYIKKFMFSVSGEWAMGKEEDNYRINVRISKRFDKK